MTDAALLERITAVKGRIQRQDEARRLEVDADKIGDRASTLSSTLRAASAAVATCALLRSQGVEVEWDKDSIRSLRNRVSRFKERSHSNSTAILEPNAQLWPSLDSFPDDAHQRMLTAWQTWLDQAFPVRDEATLATLYQIPELEEGVRSIRHGLAQRSHLRTTLPEGQSDFDAVIETAAATDQAWSELVGAGLPTGVASFLDAAGAGQATLEQFTDVVREWFESKGLEHLIRLSIGHRGGQPQ